MRLSEMNNNGAEVLAGFSNVVMMTSTFIGIAMFMAGIITLHRYATDPNRNSLGKSIIYIMTATLIMVMPHLLSSVDNTLFPNESNSTTYATTKTVESKPYIENPVVKSVKPSKPLIAKKEPIKIPEKPVDYTQFFIAVGSVIGIIVTGVLSVLGLMKLRAKLRIRKYQKIVAHVAELKNDFVTLSEHINTIDTCLMDIQTYKVSAPNKIKSLLDSMQNVLEHKKNMFNTAVKEIHETQPELKVYGGVA
jgi:hypothetical protein